MKIKQKTLSDKVNELIAKGDDTSSDESTTETSAPRIAEFDEEEYELPQAQTTEFRKRNVKLLSEQSAKYRGKIASRSDFLDEEEEDDFEASDTDDEALAAFSRQLKSEQKQAKSPAQKEQEDDDGSAFQSNAEEVDDENNSEEDEEFDESEDVEDEEDNDDDDNDDDDDDDDDDDVDEEGVGGAIISESNREAEIQKGFCVQNQLNLWERLLELRINAQKMLTKANQLPPPEEFQQVPGIDEVKQETTAQVGTLLSKLCELQHVLSAQYPELRAQVMSGQKRQAAEAENEEPASKRFGSQLQEHFQQFRTYRDSVLLKWDDRTRLLTPGAGVKRKSAQEDFDVLKKITHALSSRQTLIQRSQVAKGKQGAIDEMTQAQPHIYDDSDFYHQQLRELIEYKANTTANMSEVTRQYVELQKLRQKMKKKVDTRASKGRKIRYIVHKKLVNYMAPEDTSTWSEPAKDELYRSLFAA